MNKAQASRAWEISESDVERVCREMGIDAENIPEGTVPVYVPNELYASDPHRYYTYLLEVIANTHMDIKGIDKAALETCVEQLKEKKLIVLKKGAAPDSLDYHDYLLSADKAVFYEWDSHFMKNNFSFIEKIISFFKSK